MPGRPLQPPGWPRPRGYSHGMVARGEVIAVAGQIGWDERGVLVGAGFAEQLGQALANVAAVVREAGASPEDIVSLTIYVTDRREYVASLQAVGEAYRKVMGRHYPATALVEVAGLLEPGAKVEIQALAVKP
ncbi:MAG TPA: RidA family protein [Haliangiales bacterium]|nr:RidA family protein [Haliangiales bacterium]